MKEWTKKYGAQGFAVIGVHSPEFYFEKDVTVVEGAIKHFGINYRVALDNDFQNWRAFRNHYWPGTYLIDKEGYIRLIHIGDGEIEKLEPVIRLLLSES